MVFSEAEIAFLFPAPVRRSTLVHYKLFKSQLGILFTAFFLTCSRATGRRWRTADARGGLVDFAVHDPIAHARVIFRAHDPARAREFRTGNGGWRSPWHLAALCSAGALAWGAQEVPAPRSADIAKISTRSRLPAPSRRLRAVRLAAGPFRAVARPFLATRTSDLSRGAWTGVADPRGCIICGSSAPTSLLRKPASKLRNAKPAGGGSHQNGPAGHGPPPVAQTPSAVSARPSGPPAVAILWKNLLAAGQIFNARAWVGFVDRSRVVGYSIGRGAGRPRGRKSSACWPRCSRGWSLLLGPQFVRYDFRHDLGRGRPAKELPHEGLAGRVGRNPRAGDDPDRLAVAALHAASAVTRLARAWSFLAAPRRYGAAATIGAVIAAARVLPLAAAIVAPMLNLLSLLIPNAAALLLPGWFAGPDADGSGRGIEVHGAAAHLYPRAIRRAARGAGARGAGVLPGRSLVAGPYLGTLVAAGLRGRGGSRGPGGRILFRPRGARPVVRELRSERRSAV